jgi:hypothetical protein
MPDFDPGLTVVEQTELFEIFNTLSRFYRSSIPADTITPTVHDGRYTFPAPEFLPLWQSITWKPGTNTPF